MNKIKQTDFSVCFLKFSMTGDIIMNNLNTMVGYAFVPPQTEFITFSADKALECGTLFPELALSMCEYLNGVKEDKCNG